ncbi:NUDIX domain-containing protein [Candidatus Marsarchaeota archaeon]|nr:NUDIX domain-containing protein [Candidatus Marsarchaeota archaeon]
MARDFHRVGVLIFIESKGKVLLIKRRNTGYRDGWYCLAGGHLDAKESIIEAIAREAEEELGIIIHRRELRPVNIIHKLEKGDSSIIFTAWPRKWSGAIRNAEPEKCSEIGWHQLDRLPKRTIPYVREIIKNIGKNVVYSEHGWK